jgi:hypothetical protein
MRLLDAAGQRQRQRDDASGFMSKVRSGIPPRRRPASPDTPPPSTTPAFEFAMGVKTVAPGLRHAVFQGTGVALRRGRRLPESMVRGPDPQRSRHDRRRVHRAPNLTLCLAVQPTVIAKLAAREDFRGRGLIARFLCSYPRTKVGYRRWEAAQPIDGVASLDYAHRIAELLAVPLPGPDAAPAVVRLAPDAERVFLA